MGLTAKRIEFAEAIEEDGLLARRFASLSFPQQVALKLFYGVELSAKRVEERTGFSELDYWAIFNDFVELDELGFPKKVLPGAPPYDPTRIYREAWMVFGRRAGKTDRFAATIVSYEAACGGHEEFLQPGQQGIVFEIAQDLRMARNALHFIRATFELSPLLEREIVQVTADRIDLRNRFTIACVPATLKSVRGFASPCSVMDEVGVWYQDAESANPDYEIYRALSPGQMQFPDRKIVGISSPWNKAGLLYQYYEAGTGGWRLPLARLREQYQDALVLHGPTAVMGNPLIDRPSLARERDRDPLAFEREVLAQFQDSISGFIPSLLVDAAVERGVKRREFNPKFYYHAAIDPAFRRDAFALQIVHNEGGTIVHDASERFVGSPTTPLSPAAVLDVIIPVLQEYKLTLVCSDQYHLESLGQLFRDRGIEIIGIPFTQKNKAQLYGNLQSLFLQKRIHLLDHYETSREVKSLERTLTAGGGVSIAAPAGLHDDMASALTLACGQAMWDRARGEEGERELTKTEQYHQRIQEQIRRKWEYRNEWGSAWD